MLIILPGASLWPEYTLKKTPARFAKNCSSGKQGSVC